MAPPDSCKAISPALLVAKMELTIVLLPFVALGGAWGMAKIKRAKKEAAIKQAMSGCLVQRGHNVIDWAKVDRKTRKPRAAPPAAA